MPTQQEMIDKALTTEEISEIRDVINSNKANPDDAVYEYKEWHSAVLSDGSSFQITKTVDNTDYLFEVISEDVSLIGNVDELMDED